jgi:hypothetical protein
MLATIQAQATPAQPKPKSLNVGNLRPGNNGLTNPLIPKGAYGEARFMQGVMVRDIADKDTKPADRAALARAWCSLQEAIRVMRGLPLPGQLRPESDPVLLSKQLARALKKSPINVATIRTFNAPSEDPPEEESTPKTAGEKTEPEKKESTFAAGGVPLGGGGEAKVRGAVRVRLPDLVPTVFWKFSRWTPIGI